MEKNQENIEIMALDSLEFAHKRETFHIWYFSLSKPSLNASYVAFVFTSDDDLYGGKYDRLFPSSLASSHHSILRFVAANKVQHSKNPAW